MHPAAIAEFVDTFGQQAKEVPDVGRKLFQSRFHSLTFFDYAICSYPGYYLYLCFPVME